jgi:tetratricopeptide (TPR) repeat protein
LSVLGTVDRLQGRPKSAGERLREAATAAQAAGLTEMAGRLLFNLGGIAHEGGDLAGAKDIYDEALSRMRAVADTYGTARVLHALAGIRHQGGAPQEALALLTEACALKRRVGDSEGAANSEQETALVLLSLGRLAQARAHVGGPRGDHRAWRAPQPGPLPGHRRDDRARRRRLAVTWTPRAARPARPARWSKGRNSRGSPQPALDHLALRACLALAGGDAAAAAALAAELEQRAAA